MPTLTPSDAFSGFAVDDLAAAKEFYGQTLGVEVADEGRGFMRLAVGGGTGVLVYQKDDHWPATYTTLNFPVDDVDTTVDELSRAGVEFEHYDEPNFKTDEKGIARGMGPAIAWFRDPSGNIIAILSRTAGGGM
jgi:catechol 2,3-dioxygenase-like lactoylglutathione lyase family enzyme